MKYQVLVIDGSLLAHKSYHAPYNLTTTTGLNSTMINSALKTILSLKKKYKPETITIAWESHDTPSWRRQLYPEYKPPKNQPSEFSDLLIDLKLFLHSINIQQCYAPSNEADDVIASLVTKSPKSVLIYTTDKDIMQIVSDKEPHHIISNKHIFTTDDVFNKYNVAPYQIPDYLALVGDPSDNITGIKGIGKKRASQLLQEYDAIEYIPTNKFKNYLSDFYKAMQNKKLTTLNTDANVKPFYKYGSVIAPRPEEILHKYELKQMLEHLPELKDL